MKHFFLFCLGMILIMGGCLLAYVTYWYYGDNATKEMLQTINMAKYISGAGSLILMFVVFSQNFKQVKWKQ